MTLYNIYLILIRKIFDFFSVCICMSQEDLDSEQLFQCVQSVVNNTFLHIPNLNFYKHTNMLT